MKDNIRKRIIKSARLYDENLNNKKTLIVYCGKNGTHETIEILCRSANFLHLTGVKTELPPKVFFDRAVKGSLSTKDINVGNRHGVEKKLYALEGIVSIHKQQAMIGNYNNSRTYLKADKIVGTEKYCLALKHDIKRNCFIQREFMCLSAHCKIKYLPLLMVGQLAYWQPFKKSFLIGTIQLYRI